MKTPEERKRKLLLALPLLLLPFIALAFWAFGGGKVNPADAAGQASPGINKTLPGAQLKGQKAQDKMMLYDQAKRDSASTRTGNNAFAALGWDTVSQHKTLTANTAQANEVKINRKLAEINRQISQPEPAQKYPYSNNYATAAPASPDIDRLEKLLKQKQQATAPDPEMAQLNTMLDKIMAIQNPSMANEQPANKTMVKDSAFKAIPATIEGSQKVAPGGVVRLRLQDTLHINGMAIPKGQLLFGSCAVTNQRLLLDIKNIRLGTAIIPVNLTVFSLDGLPGINAPEAELGEAAGNGTANALDNMEFLSMDQSLGTQAATAGISAAKTLLGKKVKKIRVKLKGNTPVLLRINRSSI